jgi:exonuclease III
LPKISNAEFHLSKNSFKCTSCINKSNNANLKQKCNVCKSKLFNDAICFACNFPPPEIHELFKNNEDDFVHCIQFLFNDRILPVFERGFKCGYLNMNSLTNKYQEVAHFLDINKFDYFACTETKLTNNYTNGMLHAQGYDFLRYDRHSKSGGGTAIYIKSDHKYHCMQFDVTFPEFVEVHAVKIYPKFRKPVVVVSIYKPPSTENDIFLDSLDAFLHILTSENSNFVIMGDNNINLLLNDKPARNIKALAKLFSMKQLIINPTRVTNTSSTLIDHIFTPLTMKIKQSGNFTLTHSDHECIFVTLGTPIVKSPPKLINLRDLKHADFNEATERLKQIDLLSLFQLDTGNKEDIFTHFNDILSLLINSVAPFKKKRVKNRGNSWLTKDLIQLYKQRDACLQQARLLQSDSLFKTFRQLRNAANIATKRQKVEYFSEKFQSSSDSKNVWKVFNELTGKCITEKKIVDTLTIDGKLNHQTEQISLELAKRFVVDGPNEKEQILTFKDEVDSDNDDTYVSAKEVKTAVLGLKSRPDNYKHDIPFTFLSKTIDILSEPIAVICNRLLEKSVFPKTLKHAIVTPLYKGKGSIYDAGSFRPISTLKIFGKIIEKILHEKLSSKIEHENLFDDNQHGFRRGRSCQTALAVVTNNILTSIGKRNMKVGAVMVDLLQAYNHISHFDLLFMLKNKYKIKPKILKLLCDYFLDRTFAIKLGEFVSRSFELKTGLVQGSILSCLLFNCFFDSVYEALPDTLHCKFADDLIFYVEGECEDVIIAKLHTLLTSLDNWCISMKLKINFNKTKFMLFHKSQNKIKPDVKLIFKGEIIEKVSSFRYLGMYLDENLNFDTHFNHVLSKLSSAIGCLNVCKKYFTEKIFIIMINAFLYSVIDYGLSVWGCICNTKLQYLQNKINNFIKIFFYPKLSKLFSKQMWNKNNINDATIINVRNNLRKLNSKIEINDLLQKCNVLSVTERYNYYLLCNVWKVVKCNSKIKSLNEMFIFQERNGVVSLSQRLNIPSMYTKLACISKNSFQYKAIQLWNQLPQKNKEVGSLVLFKDSICEWIMSSRK